MYTPKCDVFSLGSYPYKDPAVASRRLLKQPEILLHWPQLPRRSPHEKLMEQTYAALLASAKKKPGFPRGYASGWNITWRLLKKRKGGVFKSQIAGPITLFNKLHATESAQEELKHYLKYWLDHAYWQIDEIKNHGFKPLIVLDEPLLPNYMGAHGSAKARRVTKLLRSIVVRLQRRGAQVGIHCCNRVSPVTLIDLGVDLVHFDAHYFPTQIARARPEIQKFISGGGIIAWGIIPTDGTLTKAAEVRLEKRFNDLLASLEARGLPLRTVLGQSMVSPTCGTSQLTVEQSEKIMDFALTLSRALKARFKL